MKIQDFKTALAKLDVASPTYPVDFLQLAQKYAPKKKINTLINSKQVVKSRNAELYEYWYEVISIAARNEEVIGNVLGNSKIQKFDLELRSPSLKSAISAGNRDAVSRIMALYIPANTENQNIEEYIIWQNTIVPILKDAISSVALHAIQNSDHSTLNFIKSDISINAVYNLGYQLLPRVNNLGYTPLQPVNTSLDKYLMSEIHIMINDTINIMHNYQDMRKTLDTFKMLLDIAEPMHANTELYKLNKQFYDWYICLNGLQKLREQNPLIAGINWQTVIDHLKNTYIRIHDTKKSHLTLSYAIALRDLQGIDSIINFLWENGNKAIVDDCIQKIKSEDNDYSQMLIEHMILCHAEKISPKLKRQFNPNPIERFLDDPENKTIKDQFEDSDKNGKITSYVVSYINENGRNIKLAEEDKKWLTATLNKFFNPDTAVSKNEPLLDQDIFCNFSFCIPAQPVFFDNYIYEKALLERSMENEKGEKLHPVTRKPTKLVSHRIKPFEQLIADALKAYKADLATKPDSGKKSNLGM